MDAYVNKGTALGILGKYRDALTSIDKALAIDPNNTAALTVRALTLYSAGNRTEATGILDKVLDIEPNNMVVFSLRMKMDNATEG